MLTTEPLYKLQVALTDGTRLELMGYEDLLNYLAANAELNGRFSGHDVSKVYPLTELQNRQLTTHDKKLMIWGAGRAGTTFLVYLFTRLNLFTGYIPYNEQGKLQIPEGGCEFGIQSVGRSQASESEVFHQFKRSPFILKVLLHGYFAKQVIFRYRIPIGHIIIPVRDHIEVAQSRIKRNLLWEFMPETEDYQVLAADIVLGKSVEAAVLAKIPLTFLRFPDIVKDEDYCWSHISPVFSDSFDIHLDRERFREEFHKLSGFSISKYSKETVSSGV